MAVTREEFISAGMSEAQARLLNRMQRQRDHQYDWTRHPVVVALVSVGFAALLGAMGWLAVSVMNVQTDVARLEAKVDGLADDVGRVEAKLDAFIATFQPEPER